MAHKPANQWTDFFLTDRDRPICVAALYKFTPFGNCGAIRQVLAELCNELGVKGTLLLAREGINGTIAGSDAAIEAILIAIRELPGCGELEVKLSRADAMPFYRIKVRVKPEIVTMGQPDLSPLRQAGDYVAAEDWNALISEPGTVVIDTRNDFEVAVGTFAGAIDPKTKTFRDFPAWFRDQRLRLLGEGTPPKIAMFCTGGIRCEKSTAFLKSQGLDEVYHLRGGILKYLETIPADASLWEGECFVFDQRVTLGHRLMPGTYKVCHACRRPVSAEGVLSPHYVSGISCGACYVERTDAQRAGYAERHRQERLAGDRGGLHVGAVWSARHDE